jgi:capsid protein
MEDIKMSFWKKLTVGFRKNNEAKTNKVIENNLPNKQAMAEAMQGKVLFAVSYDGEKNMGEAGPLKNYSLNYEGLRMRSWASYLDSEIAQTVIRRYVTWVIGQGLKLQSEPAKLILTSEEIELEAETFSKTVEARFNLYRGNKWADYSNMMSLDMIAKEVFKNAIVGGDVVVVLRYIGKLVKVQMIDGCHVQSPIHGTEQYPQQLANGVVIKNGIEMDATGKHLAYWVRVEIGKHERISAITEGTDIQSAFMVYGLKYRLGNCRGIPLLSAVLETIKKMERYKEATLGSVEERAKIVYQIVHEAFSDGSNPLLNNLATAFNSSDKVEVPADVNGKDLANQIAVSTNKQTFNMTQGAKLEALDSKQELNFSDFYETNFDIVCATVNIPPNVAKSKYDSNYSASRAAIKDWENTLSVERKEFGFQFYQPIYNFFLEVEVLQNKIIAPGYLLAKMQKNDWVIEAYRKARWVGTPVPHIDPLTEVKAERLKLGESAASIPLTTVEQATENLGAGESNSNIEQYSSELEKTKTLKILAEPILPGNVKKKKKEN